MSKYDLVLYDLDGTLQDSVPLIMESMKASYDIVLGGTDRTDEDMMSFIGKPLTPGVYDFLAKIRSLGVKQGIVTSKLESSAMITIDLLGLGQYFDDMVFREATERAKPFGDPLIEAAKRLGISDMSRVLYVGDALPDLLSARDAGCGFALVGWTKMPMEELISQKPDYLVDVPKRLPCIIKGTEL